MYKDGIKMKNSQNKIFYLYTRSTSQYFVRSEAIKIKIKNLILYISTFF